MAPKRPIHPPECPRCGGDHPLNDFTQAIADAWAAGFRIGLSSAGTGGRAATRAPGPAALATDSYRPSYGQASQQAAKRYKREDEQRHLPEEGQMDRKTRDELRFLDQEIANMKRGMGRLEERRRKLLMKAGTSAAAAVPAPVRQARPTAPVAPARDTGTVRNEGRPDMPITRARFQALKTQVEAHLRLETDNEDRKRSLDEMNADLDEGEMIDDQLP